MNMPLVNRQIYHLEGAVNRLVGSMIFERVLLWRSAARNRRTHDTRIHFMGIFSAAVPVDRFRSPEVIPPGARPRVEKSCPANRRGSFVLSRVQCRCPSLRFAESRGQ